jgi:hypothetical protein
MKGFSMNKTKMGKTATVLAGAIIGVTGLFGQPVQTPGTVRNLQELQRAVNNPAGYVDEIVARWESAARASGKWDQNYFVDLHKALTKLNPQNLVAAGEASSYEAMMKVLQSGSRAKALPRGLGDLVDDLVYTPQNPCRIVDTRNVGSGALRGNATNGFDVDGFDFTAQGGSPTGCDVPFGTAGAIAMTITAVQPAATGYLTAYAYGDDQPLAATMVFTAGVPALSTTTITRIHPGSGFDFVMYTSQTTHVVIDVIGYFAAPVATPLDCTTVTSAVVEVSVNNWTPVTAFCPALTTMTGGGFYTPEGTGGYPGVWTTTGPDGNGWTTWVDNQTNGGRAIQTYARCCSLYGR